MINRWNRYVVTALFALAFVTAGCAAKDVHGEPAQHRLAC
jgi:hypothetical protein